ncbi:hypothetical protein Thimo_0497 [Thioflavicoccus mobilis 8321]|uniref:Uncharacterized protein n=1 Tax=Thioflavicoccus mobilis 8321 TaxID=765912 RepID=L0GU60_9GAMM|nr:hypothetical protein [Thioflavicoccus mobilis]AGA89352.1 hypothetical protein Thimo_0497 [Thioflavicoccus mobilis 8321]
MNDLATYKYLFDRQRTHHPWLDALGDLVNSPYTENRALSVNWGIDHRVTRGREEDLLSVEFFPGGTRPEADFARALRRYFETRLCVAPSTPPDYAAGSNLVNRIAADTVSPNHPLVHLASMGALFRRALSSFDLRDLIFDLVGVLPPDPEDLTPGDLDRIGDGLGSAGEEAIGELAGAISDALGMSEPHWWAAFSYEVDDYLSGEDWTDAVRVLGLGHLEEGDWLIAWRYSPELAGPLYRPTVAEAAAYGYHFPSPPGEGFGVTMPLVAGLAAVKEVVHAPLKGDASKDACLGRIGRIAQPVVPAHNPGYRDWLAERRLGHAANLDDHYRQRPVTNWLARHGLNR